jgi:uncharacterized protein (TIGR02145 family)
MRGASSNGTVAVLLLLLLVASCSKGTNPDDQLPSYDLGTHLPPLDNPPDHFLLYAHFTIIGESHSCDIVFPDRSVWCISVRTSPKTGARVEGAIRVDLHTLKDDRHLIPENPDPVYIGFKSCFTYTFFFSDTYGQQRTVTFEFERTAKDYEDATVAIGDTVECEIAGKVRDVDGNLYDVVTIGTQTWMAENLRVTRYSNGEPIPNVSDAAEWSNLTTGARCDYDNDPGKVTTYGRLYNWEAVNDARNIAPSGWHVPYDEDWKQLEMCLGISQSEVDQLGWRGTDVGSKMKKAETELWGSDATNESGFSALPAGYRTSTGAFDNMDLSAYFWSCSLDYWGNAWYRTLNYFDSGVGRLGDDRHFGFSVRCVKD